MKSTSLPIKAHHYSLQCLQMASNFKAVIFDLGGVLLEWDRNSAGIVSAKQFMAIMNTTTWHDFERGNLSFKEACKVSRLPLEPRKSLAKTLPELWPDAGS